MKPKNTICLWFDKDAQEAARFYAATFPDSKVTAVHKAPTDFPSGKKGNELTVEFTVLGIFQRFAQLRFSGRLLNGEPIPPSTRPKRPEVIEQSAMNSRRRGHRQNLTAPKPETGCNRHGSDCTVLN